MTSSLRLLSLLILFALPVAVLAQQKREAIVIFKDGFDIKGTVNEKVREYVWDKDSGRGFPVMSGEFFLTDHVRTITFSPTQVTKVYQPKAGEMRENMLLKLRDSFPLQKRHILPEFEMDKIGDWTEKGDRIINFTNKANNRPIVMKQQMAMVTPQFIQVTTDDYEWNPTYFTEEIGRELTRKVALHILNTRKQFKELPDAQKYLKLAEFMQQAGWYKETELELQAIIDNHPTYKKTAEEMLDKLKAEKTNLYVDDIERLGNIGQHSIAMQRLEVYERNNFKKIVRPALAIKAADLKVKYAKTKTDIELAKAYLKTMPAYTKKNAETWTKATEFIDDELNPDTIDRLETFLLFAQQYETDRKNKKQPAQTAEEVLALAVTGWLQGKLSAEPDVKLALKLAKGRDFLTEYLTSESSVKRTNLLSAYMRDNEVPIDVLARLVRMIPPVAPHDPKLLNNNVQTVKTDDGTTYYLQLPPDYHHQRAYPVAILLHSGRDTAEDTIKRFSEDAARHGFILAAPQWTGKGFFKNKVEPGAREQQMVLDTLRDLRRRFQVDSDRVFLFGWEDGGGLAFDVGLGHPDLFAGVVPMNGVFTLFTKRFYWPNAQYLPFYVIEGDRNGGNPKLMRELFKDWTRSPYNCIYVEYKGRGSEWFGLEVPKVMDWMSRKKRYTPLKEMGRATFGNNIGEEFHSTRASNNRFYWLSCEAITDRCLHDPYDKRWAGTFRPATFQANLSIGNKSDKSGTAKIWNQVNMRVSGAKKLTFWITPGMMDLTKPLAVWINGTQVGPTRQVSPSAETLLEEVFRTGDRQRIYIAKVEL
ncbi:MAG TPA: PHB depolymerase family esterase [Gemmataceae bacterium]|nr:PHB depolymerase family esterase [Gemmataceae bacterium]